MRRRASGSLRQLQQLHHGYRRQGLTREGSDSGQLLLKIDAHRRKQIKCHHFIDETHCSPVLERPDRASPCAWLTEERREQLMEITSSVRPLLLQAGLWRATLVYWVREQVSLEVCWDPQEEQKILDELEEQWLNNAPPDSPAFDRSSLRAKLRVKPASARWSRQQWGIALILCTYNQKPTRQSKL